jgi:Tol biopolymer transport system component
MSAFCALLITLLPTLTEAFVPPEALKITNKGRNTQALFISNDNIVFVSKSRREHQDPQLYFKDLVSGKEKRITYQRGQLSTGFYVEQSGDILYSSTTDEEKETPYALKKYLNRFPASVKNDSFFHVDFSPQEVYRSRIDGSDIQRLTESSGFDGFPVYLKNKDRLYYSKWNKGKISLYAKSLKNENYAPWSVTKTSGHDLGLKLSPKNNQFIWSRFSPDFKSSQVLISNLDFKDLQYITLENGVNWSPSWHPNGTSVIYSARAAHTNNFDLFEVSIDGQCQRQLTSYAGDEFFPTVSPDGKKVLFTSTMSGGEQIYRVEYPGPLNCEKR